MANGDGSKTPKIIEKKVVGAIMGKTEEGKNAFNIIEEVKELGYIDNGTGKHQSNTVYDTDNLSPAITTVKDGGTQQIKICEKIPCKLDKMPDGHLDSMDNARLCDVGTETASTVTARYYKGVGSHKDNMVMIKQATKQGYAECELGGVADLSYPTSETRRGRVEKNGQVCPTLTTDSQICRIEKNNACSWWEEQNIYNEEDILRSLKAGGGSGNIPKVIETRYRIRKLTPRECWRLMDFSDEDYDKAEKVNSQTQLYKEAGNSIVRAVLVAIMSQLNIDGVKSWNNMSDEERVELSGKIKNQTSDK